MWIWNELALPVIAADHKRLCAWEFHSKKKKKKMENVCSCKNIVSAKQLGERHNEQGFKRGAFNRKNYSINQVCNLYK